MKPGRPGSLQDHCSHHQAAFLSSPPAVLSFVAPAPHPARLLPLSVGCDTGSKGRDSPDYGGLPGPTPHASAPSTAPWAGLACRSLQKPAEGRATKGKRELDPGLHPPAGPCPRPPSPRFEGQTARAGPTESTSTGPLLVPALTGHVWQARAQDGQAQACPQGAHSPEEETHPLPSSARWRWGGVGGWLGGSGRNLTPQPP